MTAAALAPPPMRRIPSFLGAPIAELEDLRPGDVAMIGLFLDHGGDGRFGMRFAARQTRYASTLAGLAPPQGATGRCLDLGDLNVFPLEPARQAEALRRQIGAVAAAGAVPVIVGGRGLPFALGDGVCGGRTARLPASPAPRLAEGRLALILDLAPALDPFAALDAFPRLRRAMLAIPPDRIAAAHVTGFAPDLDVGGRREASLAMRLVEALAAHLLGAPPCR